VTLGSNPSTAKNNNNNKINLEIYEPKGEKKLMQTPFFGGGGMVC
jgi:hypothetical protein